MRLNLWALSTSVILYACATGPDATARCLGTQLVAPTAQEQSAQVARIAGAESRLEAARKRYQDAVNELAVSLNLDMRAVEAHRRDLGVISPDFSDEEVRLRQRFGDGDRVGSWPAIRQLSLAWRARAAPQQRLLAAARARSDAVLFSIMVSTRDTGATNGELVALWDEAAALDPLSFEAQIGRSRAALALGDRPRAAIAADLALTSARSPAETAEALGARDRANAAT